MDDLTIEDYAPNANFECPCELLKGLENQPAWHSINVLINYINKQNEKIEKLLKEKQKNLNKGCSY